MRQSIEEARAGARAAREEVDAEIRRIRAELKESHDSLEDELEIYKAAGTVVDALMGDDIPTKEAVRSVAVLLAANPGWALDPDEVQKVTQAAVASIERLRLAKG